MRSLEVWLSGRRIGTITETRRGARFAYCEDIYEKCPGIPVLSLSMPAKRKPFGESKTRNWFEGLLPEGDRRDRACRRLGLDPLDWIGLLSEIGWECAGAVQVFSGDAGPGHTGSYESVDSARLAELLTDIARQQPVDETVSFRMSLGGFQDKLCLRMPVIPQGAPRVSSQGVCLALGDAASTHILKPEPSRYPGLAESEAWAMSAAGFAARCSRVALLDLDGAPSTLVVERYDRKIGLGTVARLHQEDACQALDLPITAKYANETSPRGGDPTYVGMAALLDRYAADADAEKAELLRQLTVNMVLGNWDAHAKNTSFLYPKEGLPVVAPMYDVVPIAEVEPRTTLLSLRVNGSLVPSSVNGDALIAEAALWGMNIELAQDVVLACLDALDRGLATARSLYPAAAARHEAAARERMACLRVVR